MSDLVAGRYPLGYEEWLLDGSPTPPYRQSMSRRDITVSTVSCTGATMFIYPVVCQPGDIIGAITTLVKTSTVTPAHSWVALYTGVSATSTLIAQSADATGGFVASTSLGVKLSLGTGAPYLVGGGPGGVAQGGPAQAPSGPVILGVALYSATGATVFDGMAGSAVAGAVGITGQVPLASSVSVASTATAPATLSGAVAATGGVAYIVLSRT